MTTRSWWNIVKGERHELPLVQAREATLPLMEIKEPTKYGANHIKDVIVPDQKENYMDHESENTSPSKEKTLQDRATVTVTAT
jgi:hypothetical protein